MANSGRALLLGAFDTTFKTGRLEEVKYAYLALPCFIMLSLRLRGNLDNVSKIRKGREYLDNSRFNLATLLHSHLVQEEPRHVGLDAG